MLHSMRGTSLGLSIPLVVVLAQPVWATEPEELRRGLIATYRDAARPTPASVVRLEPRIALALKAGETAHPRLRADGGSVAWQGYIVIPQTGDYRFAVRLRGRFRLQVAGREVLAVEVKDERPSVRESAEVRLGKGVHLLAAEFERLPGEARVELLWESKHFRREPLPFDHLGHRPGQVPPRLAADARVEQGRVLVEESACVRCHVSMKDNRMAEGLVTRRGPDLSRVGQRVRPGWLMHWLESPRHLRPGAAMPAIFGADRAGNVERYAVSRYLITLGGPLRTNARKADGGKEAASLKRGEDLFNRLGCRACHDDMNRDKGTRPFGFMAPPRMYPLGGLGSKTTPEQLAEYLKNPLAIDPSGRMPHMLLNAPEADDLARFLCRSSVESIGDDLPKPPIEQMLAAFQRVDERAEELAAFKRLPAEQQWVDLGKRLVIDKGCNNCHTIAPDGQPFASVQASASLEEIQTPDKQRSGCLDEKRGAAPHFALSAADREAIRAFLREGLNGAGSPAPGYAARAELQRFNCLACHPRDGEGGLSAALLEQQRRSEKAEHLEAVSPPPLTGVGHKLRTPWLREVLLGAGRARPWMGLRMPQFGEANVGGLPEALAALEGTEPEDTIHEVPRTVVRIEAGRHLAGKQAFGCVSCHDLAGIASTGTRGPDLAGMTQRVRYDWYRRWLEQPQRIQPGTRMPAVFMAGRSPLDRVLNGDGDAQADALWAYLLGASRARRQPGDANSGR
jgi:cbb3-type cytochrome oxidase cytochrome c subunit